MKIKGKVTKVHFEGVEVCPEEFLKSLRKKWLSDIEIPSECYINTDGEWESWEDTHGSGAYTQYGKALATDQQVEEAFRTMLGLVRGVI